MALPFLQMARDHAESLASAIREYNATAVTPESGPTFRDLVKAGRESEASDKATKTAQKAYEDALTAVNDAKKTLAEIGAGLLGVELASVGADVTDEERDQARANRKELVSTLKVLIDSQNAEFAEWASSFEIPNVGTDKTQSLGTGGTARLRVWVDVVGPDYEERFKSLSDLKLATQKKDSVLPSVDVDKIRKAFEDASEETQKEGVTGEIADGWTVTVSPKSATA